MAIEERLLRAEERIDLLVQEVAKEENLTPLEVMKILISRAHVWGTIDTHGLDVARKPPN